MINSIDVKNNFGNKMKTVNIHIILLFISLFFSLFVYSDTIDIQVTFDPEEVILGKEIGYDTVDYPDINHTTDIGKPQLCMTGVYISLPFNSTVNSVSVIDLEKQTISGDFLILPAQKPKPMSEYTTEANFTLPDPSIFNTDQFYPQNPYSEPFISNFVGSTMGGIIIYPFRYNPVDRKLELYTSLTLRLNYTPQHPTPNAVRYMENRYKDMVIESVKSLVNNLDDVEDNYEPVNLFSLSDSPPSGYELSAPDPNDRTSLPSDMLYPYTYIIITNNKYWGKLPTSETDEIPDRCQPLLNWRTEIGVPAALRTVDWIQENYWDPDNEDIQSAIRDFLKDAHENWGTQWVILIGDVNIKMQSIAPLEYKWNDGYVGIVPARFLCALDFTPPEKPVYYSDYVYCASDVYYMNLYDDFDYDGDEVYGEPWDDIQQNEQFKYSIDIFGARVPADTENEVEIFINKLQHFEKLDFMLPPSNTYLSKCIQIGADYGNENIYRLKNENYFPNFEEIENVYEGFASDPDNPNNSLVRNTDYPETWQVIYKLNEPHGIINFDTHGGWLGFHILTHEDYTAVGGVEFISSRHKYTNIYIHGWNYEKAFEDLNNAPKYSFLYSNACSTHRYDDGLTGVFGEEYLFNITCGGPITIGNLRTIWTAPFEFMKNNYFLLMKHTNTYNDDNPYIGIIQSETIQKFWKPEFGYCDVVYANRLLGCPRISIWRGDPNIFNVTTEIIQNPDNTYTLRVTVINNNTQQPVENASLCLWMINEFKYFVKQTNSYGIAEFNVGLVCNNSSLTTTYEKFNYKPDIKIINIP